MTLTCGALMRPMRTWLHQDDRVGQALDFMMERHMGLLPVVDNDHRLVGLISADRLVKYLLPKHLAIVRGLDRMSYLRETTEELRERLDEILVHPISEVMDRRPHCVKPEDALIQAQVIIARGQYVVPVIDPGSDVLVGALSAFTIFAHLRGEEAWGDRMAHGGEGPRSPVGDTGEAPDSSA